MEHYEFIVVEMKMWVYMRNDDLYDGKFVIIILQHNSDTNGLQCCLKVECFLFLINNKKYDSCSLHHKYVYIT